MSIDMKLRENSKALVCGASQGIGRAVAIELARAGVTVHAVSRSADKLKDLMDELKDINSLNHQYHSVDFLSPDQLQRFCEAIPQQSFQILICNAGGPKSGPLIDADTEEFLHGFQAHVLTNQKLVQAVLPAMKSSGWGRIVNIISTSVKVPIPNLGVSNTIRGAVAQWAKTLSLELGPHNITVNNVLPGYTETERLEKLSQTAAEKQNLSQEQILNNWRMMTPMRRFATAQEIAWAVQFLCSDQAGYISGINLPVDGGRTGCL